MSSLKYLLDTNILSEPLRPHPNDGVMSSLRESSGQLSTATVVYHEMFFGCYRLPKSSRKRQVIESYLKQEIEPKLPLLPYDAEAARWHAMERARLTAMGKPPPFVDSQIAAIAETNSLILVTNNVSDYSNFSNLTIENWYVQ